MSEFNDVPLDADKLTEPFVLCVISGGSNGWFSCVVQTSARTTDEAKAIAAVFLESVFPGKRKIVRVEPEASEDRAFEFDRRVVSGWCRFSFCLEDGPTDVLRWENETEINGFGLLTRRA